MLSPSLEDYLEEIYRLSLSGQTVRVSDVAARLGVKLPSVTRALQRLHDDAYLTYERYREITLTERGRRTGRYLVERNRTLQEFLTVIDAGCDIAAEAEAMEHYLSPSTIEAVADLVAFLRHRPECLDALRAFRRAREVERTAIQPSF